MPIPHLGRPTITVVAAVIRREDGAILIGQRPKGEWNSFKWEFPGGKMEPSETPRAALTRELREELAIEAVIGEEMMRYEFEYPGRPPIYLIFLRVKSFKGEPRNLAFEQIAWAHPSELPQYDFLDGDTDFVRRLAKGKL